MKTFTITEKTKIEFDNIICIIDCSSKRGYIKPVEITWTKDDEEYTPSLKDWVNVLKRCLDEKWSLFHQLSDVSEALYDYACFGGISPSLLRKIWVDSIDFEREAHIASIINEIIVTNRDSDEVKQYLEEREKDTAAREGVKNFFTVKGFIKK